MYFYTVLLKMNSLTSIFKIFHQKYSTASLTINYLQNTYFCREHLIACSRNTFILDFCCVRGIYLSNTHSDFTETIFAQR